MYGLKNTPYYLLVKAAEILQGEALAHKGQEKHVEDLKNFLILLKHHQNSLFGDAKYLINKSRQEKLRLPERTPPEHSMNELRTYTLGQIQILTRMTEFGRSEYVELRNLVCSRVTLFNARRGGEPSRLKVNQWLNRGQWVDQSTLSSLDEEEKRLIKELEIVYGTGKGNHLVSFLIPQDCVVAIELLVSPTIRDAAGVMRQNDFLFPSTGSAYHCGGWDATNSVCQQAGINSSIINATNQRGRISTLMLPLMFHNTKESSSILIWVTVHMSMQAPTRDP